MKSPQTICYELLEEARRLAKGINGDKDNKQVTLRINPDVAKALRTSERDVMIEIEDYLGPIDITSDPSDTSGAVRLRRYLVHQAQKFTKGTKSRAQGHKRLQRHKFTKNMCLFVIFYVDCLVYVLVEDVALLWDEAGFADQKLEHRLIGAIVSARG